MDNKVGSQPYQVILDQENQGEFELTLRAPTGETFTGALHDLSEAGAGVDFPRGQAPALGVGVRTILSLTAPGLRDPIRIDARVEFRHEQGECRRYRFRFEELEALRMQIPDGFQHLFNRRKAHRVKPDPEEPVTVTLRIPTADGLRVEGPLMDVSGSGIGVLLDLEVETTAFAAVDLIEAAFALPPSHNPVQFLATICSRRLSDEAVVFGLEFEAERSKDFNRQQESVVDYVMQRQRADLQSKALHRR